MIRSLSGGAYVRLLSAVYAATLLIRLAFGVSTITLPRYLDVDNSGILGLVIAASPFFEFITILVIGPYIDRYGSRRILLAGLLLGAVSLFGTATTQNALVVTLFNALHGVSAAAILVPTLAILAEVAPEKHRGREMGVFNFVNLFGWFGGFAFGYVLLEQFAGALWITFLVAGILAFLGFVWAFYNIREQWRGISYDHAINIRTFATVLREKDVLLLGLPWFIVFFFIASLITFQVKVLGVFSGVATAGAIAGIGLVFVLTQIVYGKLSDLYGRNPLIIAGALGFVGLMLVVTIASWRGQDVLYEMFRLWPLVAFFSLLTMAFPPAALAALADVAQYLPKGITMSIYTLAVSLGFIAGPPTVGFVHVIWGTPGVVVFFMALAVSLLVAVLVRYVESKGGIGLARRVWLRGPPGS